MKHFNLSEWALEHQALVLFFMLALFAAGLFSYFKLGQAYGERKKWDQAITLYKKATAVEPDNAEVWSALGYAYKEKKQKTEAASAFEHYLAKKPDADDKKQIEDEIDYLKGR